jgi:pimeloyl-ACP methyl ester carboxylesterase
VADVSGRAGRSPPRALLAVEICLVATLLLVGCGGDAIEGGGRGATALDTSLAPPQRVHGFEGRFEVGGHELFLDCNGSGSPTVVHLHSLGGTSRNSAGISDDLASATRFCSYDRTNMGDSDKPGRLQTALDSVRELDTLVSAANIDGPLVLVGASFGGLIATMYAATYPEDVAGLVLLDATVPSRELVDPLIPSAD